MGWITVSNVTSILGKAGAKAVFRRMKKIAGVTGKQITIQQFCMIFDLKMTHVKKRSSAKSMSYLPLKGKKKGGVLTSRDTNRVEEVQDPAVIFTALEQELQLIKDHLNTSDLWSINPQILLSSFDTTGKGFLSLEELSDDPFNLTEHEIFLLSKAFGSSRFNEVDLTALERMVG